MEKELKEWAERAPKMPLLNFIDIRERIPREFLPTVENLFREEEFLIAGVQSERFNNLKRTLFTIILIFMTLITVLVTITIGIGFLFNVELINLTFPIVYITLTILLIILYYFLFKRRKYSISFILFTRREIVHLSLSKNDEVIINRINFSLVQRNIYFIIPTINSSLSQTFENSNLMSTYRDIKNHNENLPYISFSIGNGKEAFQILSENVEEDLSRILTYSSSHYEISFTKYFGIILFFAVFMLVGEVTLFWMIYEVISNMVSVEFTAIGMSVLEVFLFLVVFFVLMFFIFVKRLRTGYQITFNAQFLSGFETALPINYKV